MSRGESRCICGLTQPAEQQSLLSQCRAWTTAAELWCSRRQYLLLEACSWERTLHLTIVHMLSQVLCLACVTSNWSSDEMLICLALLFHKLSTWHSLCSTARICVVTAGHFTSLELADIYRRHRCSCVCGRQQPGRPLRERSHLHKHDNAYNAWAYFNCNSCSALVHQARVATAERIAATDVSSRE